MVIPLSHALGFLGFVDRPLLIGENPLFIQVGFCLDKVIEFSSSEYLSYLNCLSWRRLESNILIWIGRTYVRLYPGIFIQL